MSTPTVTSDPREAVTELLAEESADGSLQIQERIALCRECLRGVVAVAEDWATLSANGKGCPGNSSVLAEEMLSGPAVVARQLWLTIQTLQNVERHQSPILPGRPFLRDDGRTVVPVFPARGVFDTVTFSGLRATLQMQPQVTEADLHGATLQQTRAGVITGLTAVLGAGNVSSIPATDSLNRIMFECRRVVLKLNPVNEYLRPVFADAFASLIRRRLLRIVTGDGQVGQSLVHDDRVTDVHITGSVDTHNAIVWGTTPEERHQRQQNNDRLVQKAVTSELGNVTPWIVAPGRYSERQLRSQATHVAASITNNAAFNCLATRVILTWNRWDQRDQFLALLKQRLTDTPTRPAYYPGAVDRFRRFSGLDIEPDQNNHLPWTLLERQSIEDRPELFTEESFACVCAETALAADTPEHFLQAAAAFANDRMHGTLCCSVTLPRRPATQQPHWDRGMSAAAALWVSVRESMVGPGVWADKPAMGSLPGSHPAECRKWNRQCAQYLPA
jgi:hypothetical protein